MSLPKEGLMKPLIVMLIIVALAACSVQAIPNTPTLDLAATARVIAAKQAVGSTETAVASATAEAATVAAAILPATVDHAPVAVKATAAATEKPLAVTENTEVVETDVLGEISLEYPVRMMPGSSNSVNASIYIPFDLAPTSPIDIARVIIFPDFPPLFVDLNDTQTRILVAETMRIELTSPTFQITPLTPATQTVNISGPKAPTQWAWTIVAPNASGPHILTIQVYRGEDTYPSWVGSIQAEVIEFSPTPIPTATEQPTD
jgi:hypothetical protein